MRYTPPRATSKAPQTPFRKDPLDDQRYKDLISRASAFFANAERDVEAEKLAAIAEIKERMALYGLTVEDILRGEKLA
ncbi:hypothetical protein [Hydrogenophaga sp. OTU3427]|uniref:hypothetical protein n=1 Tax=Hydrogenophaga sp. OTU3427 TaxID=3043856 RepID=UPI00313C441F